tara:strand:+ start:1066 stop:1758 length:693 start_codon:yes stop_codon:yes gene_type:complete
MNEQKYTFEEVWKTLSAVNVNEHTDEKQGLTYLSWAWAWGIMMQYYPEFQFSFYETEDGLPYVSLPDGSAEVRCTVTIGNLSRTQSLPLSIGFKPIINPNAFQINTAKQRCLTKCFGIYGLGHYIYANEDLPQDEVSSDNVKDTKQEVQKNDEDVQNGMSRASDIGWANTFVKGFKNLVKKHKTRESVQNYYKSNGKSIKRLESINPDMLADIDNYCKEYIATLEEKNDG